MRRLGVPRGTSAVCSASNLKMTCSVDRSSEGSSQGLLVSSSVSSQKRHGWINPRLWRWRYKSTETKRDSFTNKWWIPRRSPDQAEWQLMYEKAHEREATENFATYATDKEGQEKPYFKIATDNLDDMPPMDRLEVLKGNLQDRYQVNDGNRSMEKTKMLLKALECYEDLQGSGRIPENKIDRLGTEYLDEFEHFAEALLVTCERSVSKHPDVVAAMLRTAEICDKCGHTVYRDRALERAEGATERMDSAFPHMLPPDHNKRKLDPELMDAGKHRHGDIRQTQMKNNVLRMRSTMMLRNKHHGEHRFVHRWDRLSPKDHRLTVSDLPYPRSALQLPRYQRFKFVKDHQKENRDLMSNEHPTTVCVEAFPDKPIVV